MSFELGQLREAAEKYTYHYAGTHGVYPRLVWEQRNKSPVARLDDATEFLGKWKALRFKGGKVAFSRICNTWLRNNLADLQRLQGKRDHARTVGYYEPITMILDHLAFSPKLSARAVVALGGPSQAFSEDLFHGTKGLSNQVTLNRTRH